MARFPQESIWAKLHTAFDQGVLDSSAIAAGKIFYVDAVHGSDVSGTGSHGSPFASLEAAFAETTSGHNDTVVIVGDGASTATVRVDAAFTWDHDATHLVGICSGSLYSPRARLAPTAATTAFANFFTVSGNGCRFENVQFLHDFNTDTNNQVCVTVTGARNVFSRCHIAGNYKGSDTGGRSLLLSGADETLFEDCVIGQDTVGQSVASATVGFASASERTVFRRCHFPKQAAAAGALTATVAAAGIANCTVFEDCLFLNYSTITQTAVATLASGAGGWFIYNNCCLVKTTGYGSDATTRGLSYICGGTPAAATTGLAVAPSA